MDGSSDGEGPKRAELSLEMDFTLAAGQQAAACVDLEGEWREDATVVRHPGFADPNFEFIHGEVGEGGDHMNITFKNIGSENYTIKGDTLVVIVNEGLSSIVKCIKNLPTVEAEQNVSKDDKEANEANKEGDEKVKDEAEQPLKRDDRATDEEEKKVKDNDKEAEKVVEETEREGEESSEAKVAEEKEAKDKSTLGEDKIKERSNKQSPELGIAIIRLPDNTAATEEEHNVRSIHRTLSPKPSPISVACASPGPLDQPAPSLPEATPRPAGQGQGRGRPLPPSYEESVVHSSQAPLADSFQQRTSFDDLLNSCPQESEGLSELKANRKSKNRNRGAKRTSQRKMKGYEVTLKKRSEENVKRTKVKPTKIYETILPSNVVDVNSESTSIRNNQQEKENVPCAISSGCVGRCIPVIGEVDARISQLKQVFVSNLNDKKGATRKMHEYEETIGNDSKEQPTLVSQDVNIYMEDESLSIPTSSLVLAEASPILSCLLRSQSHCDGCEQKIAITLVGEERKTVQHLLDFLHTKYLRHPRRSAPEKEEWEKINNLAHRLHIEFVEAPSYFVYDDQDSDHHDLDMDVEEFKLEDDMEESLTIIDISSETPVKEATDHESLTIVDVNSEPTSIRKNQQEKENAPCASSSISQSVIGEVDARRLKIKTVYNDENAGTNPLKRVSAQDKPTRSPSKRIKLTKNKLERSSTDTEENPAPLDIPNQAKPLNAFPESQDVRKPAHPDNVVTLGASKDVRSTRLKREAETPKCKPQKDKKPLRMMRYCGSCKGCSLSEDCGQCTHCLDKPKFGGPGIKKQKCELRWCDHHPRINRGPGSLRKEAVKCNDCGEEYFLGQRLTNHMKIIHDKYDVDCGYHKIRDPSLTLKRVDKNHKFKHLFEEEIKDSKDDKSPSKKSPVKNMEKERNNILVMKEKLKMALRGQKSPSKKLPSERSQPGNKRGLKCAFCNVTENSRSDLYGHYSRNHFKTEIAAHAGTETKECKTHGVIFAGQIGMVVHFGRVHNLLESFLPKEHHIPISSRAVKNVETLTNTQGTSHVQTIEMNSQVNNTSRTMPDSRHKEANHVTKKARKPFLEDIAMLEKQLIKKPNHGPKKNWTAQNWTKIVFQQQGKDPPQPSTSMVAHTVMIPMAENLDTSFITHKISDMRNAQCSVCSEQFASIRRAIIHEVEVCQCLVRECHPCFRLNFYQCSICQQNFVLKRKFELHMNRHNLSANEESGAEDEVSIIAANDVDPGTSSSDSEANAKELFTKKMLTLRELKASRVRKVFDSDSDDDE